MASGHVWTSEDTRRFSAEWSTSESTVQHLAAEGSRYLRLFDPADRETLRTKWLTNLDTLVADAMRDARTGDRAAAVAAIRVGGELAGLTSTAPSSLSPVAGTPFRSAREALAWAEAALPKLREAAAREAPELEQPVIVTEGEPR